MGTWRIGCCIMIVFVTNVVLYVTRSICCNMSISNLSSWLHIHEAIMYCIIVSLSYRKSSNTKHLKEVTTLKHVHVFTPESISASSPFPKSKPNGQLQHSSCKTRLDLSIYKATHTSISTQHFSLSPGEKQQEIAPYAIQLTLLTIFWTQHVTISQSLVNCTAAIIE